MPKTINTQQLLDLFQQKFKVLHSCSVSYDDRPLLIKKNDEKQRIEQAGIAEPRNQTFTEPDIQSIRTIISALEIGDKFEFPFYDKYECWGLLEKVVITKIADDIFTEEYFQY